MNYTEKYHLPQWEKTDRIMMDDFNRMCADVEEGLRETAAAAASALSAANSKPSSSAVSNAQNTANQALAKANAAYCPDFKPYVTGTYTGKGDGQVNEVTVGFKPLLLIITGQDKSSNAALTFFRTSGGGHAEGDRHVHRDRIHDPAAALRRHGE